MPSKTISCISILGCGRPSPSTMPTIKPSGTAKNQNTTSAYLPKPVLRDGAVTRLGLCRRCCNDVGALVAMDRRGRIFVLPPCNMPDGCGQHGRENSEIRDGKGGSHVGKPICHGNAAARDRNQNQRRPTLGRNGSEA